jgi:hypothetical protein
LCTRPRSRGCPAVDLALDRGHAHGHLTAIGACSISQVEEFAPRIRSTRRRDRSRLARYRQVSGVPVAPGAKMPPALIVIALTVLVPASMAPLLTVTAELVPLTTSASAAYRGGAA